MKAKIINILITAVMFSSTTTLESIQVNKNENFIILPQKDVWSKIFGGNNNETLST